MFLYIESMKLWIKDENHIIISLLLVLLSVLSNFLNLHADEVTLKFLSCKKNI